MLFLTAVHFWEWRWKWPNIPYVCSVHTMKHQQEICYYYIHLALTGCNQLVATFDKGMRTAELHYSCLLLTKTSIISKLENRLRAKKGTAQLIKFQSWLQFHLSPNHKKGICGKTAMMMIFDDDDDFPNTFYINVRMLLLSNNWVTLHYTALEVPGMMQKSFLALIWSMLVLPGMIHASSLIVSTGPHIEYYLGGCRYSIILGIAWMMLVQPKIQQNLHRPW